MKLKRYMLALGFFIHTLPVLSQPYVEENCTNNNLVEDFPALHFNATSHKTIRLKFHIPRIKSPFWGFTQVVGDAAVNDIITSLNAKTSNNQQPTLGNPYPFLWDINIDFALVEIEYYDFESFCNLTVDSFNIAGNAQNIFMIDQCDLMGPCEECVSGYDSYLDIPFSTEIVRPYYEYLTYSGPASWSQRMADNIIHEIGHNASLTHAFLDGPSPICWDMFYAATACTYNNFMDGCPGLKSTFSPCQIGFMHDYLEQASQISQESTPNWNLPTPVINIELDDWANGIRYIYFNAEDFPIGQIEVAWRVNGNFFTHNELLQFNLLEFSGQTIELCLYVRDISAKTVLETCDSILFPVIDTCQPAIAQISSSIIVEHNPLGLPHHLSFEFGSLSNVQWSFQSTSGLTIIDSTCIEEPILTYPPGLMEFYGDTLLVCVERYNGQSNNGCVRFRCDSIIIPPVYPSCQGNAVGFDYTFVKNDSSQYPNLRLIANSFGGPKKAFWRVQTVTTGEYRVYEGSVVDIPYEIGFHDGFSVCLFIVDFLNDCKTSKVCQDIPGECYANSNDFGGGDIVGWLENDTTVFVLQFRVWGINHDLSSDEIDVYINNQQILGLSWAIIQASGSIKTYRSYYRVPGDCGKFDINIFVKEGCFYGGATHTFGSPPCPIVNDTPTFTNLLLYPNPMGSLAGLTINFNAQVSESIEVRVLNQIGNTEFVTSTTSQIGFNEILIHPNFSHSGFKTVLIYGASGFVTQTLSVE